MTANRWTLSDFNSVASIIGVGLAIFVMLSGLWLRTETRFDNVEKTQAVHEVRENAQDERLQRIETKVDALTQPPMQTANR